jgi:hypothetical protein
MADFIASIDAGSGGVNAVLLAGKKRTTFYMPSCRAPVTGATLGSDFEEVKYNYADWYGQRYVFGDDTLKVTRRRIEHHIGTGRYGNEFHQFLIAVALTQMGVKSGTVDLTLFAPPGIYKEAKEQMVKALKGETVKIQLRGDKKPREWTYENVSVVPEGIGAAACFVLDEKGKPAPNPLFSGDVIIMDGGVWTLDVLLVQNGVFNPETLQHATWKNDGLDSHIRQPLLRSIHGKGGDFAVVTVDDVDVLLRDYAASGTAVLEVAGKEADLTSAIRKLADRYAEYISNSILDHHFSGLAGIRSALVIGGGAFFTTKALQDFYPDKIVDFEQYGLSPVIINAEGGLRLAQRRTNGN